jgi:hypothetical protein
MNYTVESARRELFDLLDRFPELRDYQNTLSNAMDKVEDHERLRVLGVFLQYNLSDLKFELMELQRLLGEGNN